MRVLQQAISALQAPSRSEADLRASLADLVLLFSSSSYRELQRTSSSSSSSSASPSLPSSAALCLAAVAQPGLADPPQGQALASALQEHVPILRDLLASASLAHQAANEGRSGQKDGGEWLEKEREGLVELVESGKALIAAANSGDHGLLGSARLRFAAAVNAGLDAAAERGLVASLPDLLAAVLLSFRTQRTAAQIMGHLKAVAELVGKHPNQQLGEKFRALVQAIKALQSSGDAYVLPHSFEFTPLYSILVDFQRAASLSPPPPPPPSASDPVSTLPDSLSLFSAASLVSKHLDRFLYITQQL